MKKIYLSFSFILIAAVSFGQSTAWLPADSARSIPKPGSGPGNPVWNTGTQPLMHNGVSYVTASTLTGGGINQMMDHAYYYDFNLAVPVTATITGVEVIFSRFACNGGDHSEDTISLAYNGVAIGNYVADTMNSVDITDTFGSSTDTWGNTLTPAMVNANSFGVYYDTRSVGTCTMALQDCRIKVHYQNSTGISGVAESKTVKLYPNPASASLVIESADSRYSVTDQLGRVVLNGAITNKTTVNISALNPGLYFLHSGNEVMKFVKQ